MNLGLNFLNRLKLINFNQIRCCYSGDKKYLPFERDRYQYRFGYHAGHHEKGLLPRLNKVEKCIPTVPLKITKDPWHKREALFGQNDYIDILGSGNLQPYQLLKNVPFWLRGFRGNEMVRLQRRTAAFPHWKWHKPYKWSLIEKRIDFLYKYLNMKSKPPGFKNY